MKKLNKTYLVLGILFISYSCRDKQEIVTKEPLVEVLNSGYFKKIDEDISFAVFQDSIFFIAKKTNYLINNEGNKFDVEKESKFTRKKTWEPIAYGDLFLCKKGIKRNDTITIFYDKKIISKVIKNDVLFQTSFYKNEFKSYIESDILKIAYEKAISDGYYFKYNDFIFILYEDYLYIVAEKDRIINKFMCHILKPDNSFVNRDFSFEVNRIDSYFYNVNSTNFKISRIRIKLNDKYSPLVIGEYTRNKEGIPILLWNKKILPSKILGNEIMSVKKIKNELL